MWQCRVLAEVVETIREVSLETYCSDIGAVYLIAYRCDMLDDRTTFFLAMEGAQQRDS